MAPLSRHPLADPAALGSRETHLIELALEQIYHRPYTALVKDVERTRQCEVRDLHELGRRVLGDMVRVARGEISEFGLPSNPAGNGPRLPYRGEYRTAVA